MPLVASSTVAMAVSSEVSTVFHRARVFVEATNLSKAWAKKSSSKTTGDRGLTVSYPSKKLNFPDFQCALVLLIFFYLRRFRRLHQRSRRFRQVMIGYHWTGQGHPISEFGIRR